MFNLSDRAREEARHDVALFRGFVVLGGEDERVPDETADLRLRPELEKYKLAPKFLQSANELLLANGLMLPAVMVVDVTPIAAPSSTKNAERDPERKQSKSGNQWYFGMRPPIAVEADLALVQTVRGTAGSVNDVLDANALLHG